MNAVVRLLERVIRWQALVAWMALIFALSSIPNHFASAEDTLPIDKAVHLVEFGILALMIAWLGLGARAERLGAAPAASIAAGAVALALLYGVTDELHQRFVPGRDPSWTDLGADAMGAVAGAMLATFMVRQQGRTGERHET